MPSKEVPADRLTTTDAQGNRLYVYPADVSGPFRRLKSLTNWLLILIFLVLPWIHIHGHQAILLDIPKRRFAIFGVTFWAHDAPMVFFLVGGFALSLFLVTAIWGRVWCGWACPQTVFVDGVFRWIERRVEGGWFQRYTRDKGPLTFDRFWRKVLKWSLFLAVSLVITHSFLAYFIGTEELYHSIRSSPEENPLSFAIMLGITGVLLFDFGWFREQFCTIACPYGRFQSVLMDDRSLLIAYDHKRGEPRRGTHQSEGVPQGDCIACSRCVRVCPTGIDIRHGSQMECTACTACIDACDEMMVSVDKPKGLIRYTSISRLAGASTAGLSPRSWIYLIVLSVFAAGLSYRLLTRRDLDLTFVRFVGSPYEMATAAATGRTEVINHYKIDFSNQSFDELEISLEPGETGKKVQLISPLLPLRLTGGTTQRLDLFVRFPKEILSEGKTLFPVRILSKNHRRGRTTQALETLKLVGPYL